MKGFSRPSSPDGGCHNKHCLKNAAQLAERIQLDFSGVGGFSGWLDDIVQRFREVQELNDEGPGFSFIVFCP